MAAAAVFKNREQQPPSLSAAAAAAALRARPMTPTNVGEVQTKRTMRRTASVSSSGTAPDIQGRPGLQRRGSSASMTERTFRSPSPGAPRPGSSLSDNARSHSREPAPPVPALPKNVDNMNNSRHKKTQSLQLSSTPLRLASQTMGKPGSGSWFGAAQVGDLGNVRTSDAAMASPPLSPPPINTYPTDEERPDSRNSSINFSYPSRVRIGSPAPSPTATRGGYESPPPTRLQEQAAQRASSGSSSLRQRPASVGSVQSLVYDPNSRRMVPREIPTYQEPQTATMGRTKVAPAAAVYENVAQPPRAAAASPKPRQAEPERQAQHVRVPSSVISDDSIDSANHQPARTNVAPATTKPTETGRVPFATHAARDLVDSKPQEPQQSQHEADEEPALKSLISAPRSDAAKTEQQRPQELVQTTSQPEIDNTGPEEFTWTGQGVRRQPSTVKEEPELEEEELHSPGGGHTVTDALDAVPTRQKVYQQPVQQRQPETAGAQSNTYATPARQPAAIQNPRPVQTTPASEPKPATSRERKTSIQRERSVSSSPARTARFGGVQDNLTVRHAPPARSVSPRKSALKNSSTSPDRHGSADDNASEASSSHRDDAAIIARKRSVRVSFNDSENVVVGESPGPDMGDSPIIASPQNTRRPWFSNVGRAKKPEVSSLDDDEIMKPRPVLPSFGSVRDKKPRESAAVNEERPLVRPVSDQSTSPPIPASPNSLPSIPHVSDELRIDSSLNALATGSDSIGSSQAESERRAKIAANTSRFREPLPPVVTSVEGGGYMSDSSTSEDDQALPATTEDTSSENDTTPPTTSAPVIQQHEVTPNPNRLSQVSMASSEGDFHDAENIPEEEAKTTQVSIPTIAVSMPTPLPSEVQRNVFFGVPGGFPDDDSEDLAPDADPYSNSEHASLPEIKNNSTLPVREATFEPVVQHDDAAQTSHTPATVIATALAPVGEEDDDESSIYSDAPDHFTDTENEGFMSLDAVVESSLPTRAKKTQPEPTQSVSETPTPTQRAPQLGTELSTATTAVEPSQQGEPVPLDWDKAKAYWRSLTADKRAQLEKEALSDVGDDADVEEDKDTTPKPKKKKSIERRNSERKALAVRMAQQTIAAEQQKQAEEDRVRAAERTYMIKPGTKAAHDHPAPQRVEQQRKSGANSPENPPKLRASMRNGAAPKPAQQEQPRQHALGNKTLRSGPAGQAAPPPTKTMRAAPQRVSSPPVATAAARNIFNPPPPIRRRGSDSSESSFRRFSSRPDSGQGFGFRKTLRQQSPAQSDRVAAVPGKPSGRFSLRSMSPPSPANRASMGSGMGMRTSLRGSSIKETKPSGGGLFSKSAKSTPRSKAGSSRFSDSSDDDAGPRTFRSRFDDSSDEDDVRSAPSISMPKSLRSDPEKDWGKANRRLQPAELSPPLPEEQEESDLEDPIREEKQPTSQRPKPATSNSRSGRGGFVSSPPTTPLEKPKAFRRGSFLSVLRRKKDKGGIARPEVMDSAARRDTKLERSTDELNAIRRSGDMDRESTTDEVVRPRSPRLQKRTNSMPLDAVVGSAWPLGSPGVETNGGKDRPSTSGNLGTRTMGGSRPALVGRRTGSESLFGRRGTQEGGVAGGTEVGKKKKKFGPLRKMFGLDD
ncbi:hypothetical protein GE09DRAFT_1149198 [Coniochaeta sp. 2T2.1]|nr:hypothetical protein GE09DRAFT_1149198 [Coniochaeta sp. 2T2.1]